MVILLYLFGALTAVGGVLAIVSAPTAVQEIGGAALWGFGWLMVGVGLVASRLERILHKLQAGAGEAK